MSPPKILFVCLGNICRSPTVEAVFRTRAARENLDVFIESAGTSGWHKNEAPDPRAIEAGEQRGYNFAGQASRKVIANDFIEFDYVLAMDMKNIQDLKRVAPQNYPCKLDLLLDYAPNSSIREVPDPYYGGADGFDHVLDLIEAASDGLIAALRAAH